MDSELKPFWKKLFDFNWKFGAFLILLVCVPRFILVLQANASGNYGAIGLIMLVSAVAPFIFLHKQGRNNIGIKGSKEFKWLLLAFISGIVLSLLLYFLGMSLYGNSYENWYVYIGKSYNIPKEIRENDKAILFSIMALTGMIFSPIGEELFFRGIVHASFAKSIGEKKASLVDSAAFALVHISHFGLVFVDDRWQLLTFPAILWVIGMFLVSLVFFFFKERSGSLLGAIFCHAAFNLGMIWCIFYGL